MAARCPASSPKLSSLHFLVKVATSTPPSFSLPFSANAFACTASSAFSFSSRDMSLVGFSVILSAGIAGGFGVSAALLDVTCIAKIGSIQLKYRQEHLISHVIGGLQHALVCRCCWLLLWRRCCFAARHARQAPFAQPCQSMIRRWSFRAAAYAKRRCKINAYEKV